MGIHKKCIMHRLRANAHNRLGPSKFGIHLKKKFVAGRLSALEVCATARASESDAADVKHLGKMTPGTRKRRGKDIPDSRGPSKFMSRLMDKHAKHYDPLIANVPGLGHVKTNR